MKKKTNTNTARVGLYYDKKVDVYSFHVFMNFIMTKGKVKFIKNKEYIRFFLKSTLFPVIS